LLVGLPSLEKKKKNAGAAVAFPFWFLHDFSSADLEPRGAPYGDRG